MEEEPRYPRSAIITMAAWIGTAGVLLLAWVVWMLGGDMMFAILIAETACTLSAVAAVLQLRCFLNRNLRMMRVLHGLDSPDDAEVRQIGPRG